MYAFLHGKMEKTLFDVIAESLEPKFGLCGKMANLKFHDLPPVDLWNSEGMNGANEQPHDIRDVSDVSSVASSLESAITASQDSVSIMTSSASSGSVLSLEKEHIGPSRHIPYVGDPSSKPYMVNDDAVVASLETHLQDAQQACVQMAVCTRLWTCGDSSVSYSTTKAALDAVKEAHRLTCLLSSIDLYLKLSDVGANDKIMAVLENMFEGVCNVYAASCQLLPMAAESLVRATFVEMFPFVIDILFTSGCRKPRIDTRDIQTYEYIVKSCIGIACAACEDSQDSVRITAATSLLRICKVTRPLEFTMTLVPQHEATPQDNQALAKLCDLLRQDYMSDEFKSSEFLLANVTNLDNVSHEKDIQLWRDVTFEIGFGLLEATCTRRQFPVDTIDVSQCKLDALCITGARDFWSRLNFWALLLLEDCNATVRNLGIEIIKHMICTTPMIEKNRQFLLGHVYDSLNDDVTFMVALDLLVAISHVYPLKDGAIRKISTLTLKGSRTSVRIETIKALAKCRLTIRGLRALIDVFQTLAKPAYSAATPAAVASGTTSTKSNRQYATSNIVDLRSEISFCKQEWPAIVRATCSLASQQEHCLACACTMPVILNGETSASNWISLLACLYSNNEHGRMLKEIFSDEANLRFPDVLMRNANSSCLSIQDAKINADKSTTEYIGVFRRFMSFKTSVENDFARDEQGKSMITACKPRGVYGRAMGVALAQVQDTDLLGDSDSTEPDDDDDMQANIRMVFDYAPTNVLQRPSSGIAATSSGGRGCSNYYSGYSNLLSRNTNGNINRSFGTHYPIVHVTGPNDVDVIVFPTFLGTQITVKVRCFIPEKCSSWHASVTLYFPRIINGPKIAPMVMVPTFKRVSNIKNCIVYVGMGVFTLQFPHATPAPVRLSLIPRLFMPLREPVVGNREIVWIYPIQSLG